MFFRDRVVYVKDRDTKERSVTHLTQEREDYTHIDRGAFRNLPADQRLATRDRQDVPRVTMDARERIYQTVNL